MTGGFFPIGGGGPFIDAEECGLGPIFPAELRRFAIEGVNARGRVGPFWLVGSGGAALGGLGAASEGGFGAELCDDSGSDVEEDSRFAALR